MFHEYFIVKVKLSQHFLCAGVAVLKAILPIFLQRTNVFLNIRNSFLQKPHCNQHQDSQRQ